MEQDDAFPDLSVVVVTHESVTDIGACLSALADGCTDIAHEVVVVDNASRDGTAALVSRHFPEARLMRTTRRQGFAANCNLGASIARGRMLLFLNPDARVAPGAVRRLAEHLDAHPEIAVVGPRLVYPDGSPQPSARCFPRPAVTLIRRTPLRWVLPESASERRHLMLDLLDDVGPGTGEAGGDGRGDAPGNDVGGGDDARTVDWVLGAAMLVPTGLFHRLGGMDEGYRLYCEDIDLCFRVWEAGLGVTYLPAAVVEHRLSELTRKRFLTRATLWHGRGMVRFVRRHGLRRPPLAGAWPSPAEVA